jgi:DNA mismatch repair protein MutL
LEFNGSLSDGQNPAAWLWIEMDPSLVDVNVHPAKREVRFQNAVDLREGCAHAVSQALQAWHDARSLPVRLVEAKSFAPMLPREVVVAAPAAVTPRAWVSPAKQTALPLVDVPIEAVESPKEATSVTSSAAVPVRERFRFLEILLGRFVL